MQRNHSIDILKGIAILTVVLGHTRFIGTDFIYLFHMAVFFMASGYFYKSKYSDSIKSVGKAFFLRIKRLWLPYVVWNTIFTLLNNVFIKCNIYTSDKEVANYLDESLVSIHSEMMFTEMIKNIIKGLLFAGQTELGGAFWFLRILFYISVAYICIDYILKKFVHNGKGIIICQGIVSSGFLCVGYFMSLKGIDTFSLDRFFSCYCLYYLGMLMNTLIRKKWEKNYVYAISAVVCFVALWGLGKIGSISLGKNNYVNPFFMLACSILGWIMIYAVSLLLEKIDFFKYIFSLIGQDSIIIVILCIKPVNVIVALKYGWPMQTVAGFPVSINSGAWWILYTAVSVGLCLMIAFLWKKVKKAPMFIGAKNEAELSR